MSDNPRDHEVTAALAQLRPRHQLDPAVIAFRAGQMSRRSELRFWRGVAGLALALAAIGWLLPFFAAFRGTGRCGHADRGTFPADGRRVWGKPDAAARNGFKSRCFGVAGDAAR